MKKLRYQKFVILFFSLLLLFFSIPSIKILASNSSSENEKQIVRVGWYPLEGFQDGTTPETLNGYSYEFLSNIANYFDWELEYYFASWDECYQAQIDGTIDLLCGVIKTEKRENEVLFSDRHFGYKNFMLSATIEDQQFSSNNYSSLNNMKIGVSSGSYGTDEVEQFKIDENLDFTTVYFSSIDDVINALHYGDIDVALDNSIRRHTTEFTIVKFPEQPIYITVQKSKEDLLANVNYAMNQIYSQTKDYDLLLHKKYFRTSYTKNLMVFSKEELDFINTTDPITVYYDSNWEPISYSDNSGNFQGPVREIFDLISESTGLTFKYRTADTFDLVQTKYQNDDLAILATIENDMIHANKIDSDLTLPYLSSTRVLLSKKEDYQDIATIGIPYGYYSPYQLLHDTRFEIIHFPTILDCIQATNEGKVDSVTASLSQANTILSNPLYKDLNIIMLSQMQDNTSMAIKKDSPEELLSILNKAISSFSEEELNTIVFNYTNKPINLGIIQNLYENPWILLLWLLLTLTLIYFVFDKHQQKKYTKKLEIANLKIKKANTAKSEFLGRMSHDMRTPMNAIINISQFGLDEVKDPNLLEYFKQIYSSSLYLLSLVDDILNMQKLEFNKTILNPQIVEIETLLKTNERVLSEHAKNKKIIFNAPFIISPKYKYILIDSLRLNQIIMNIANNAIKYTPKYGTITWTTKIEETHTATFLSLCIEDNGVGMSHKFQSHLFERFTQEKNSQSNSEGGSGLGLAISKNLVTAMNGNIFFSSELDVGTTFTIKIPFSIPAQKDFDLFFKKIASKNKSRNDLNGKNILICEDLEVNAIILKKILNSYQIHSECAENGKIGLEMAKSHTYDLILMDIRMPVMDGLIATKEIRKFDKLTPIVALSANTYDEDIEKSISAGMNAHLSKPISKEALYDSLVTLLKTDA